MHTTSFVFVLMGLYVCLFVCLFVCFYPVFCNFFDVVVLFGVYLPRIFPGILQHLCCLFVVCSPGILHFTPSDWDAAEAEGVAETCR